MTVWRCSRCARVMLAKLFHFFQISAFKASVPTGSTPAPKVLTLEKETNLESGANGSNVLSI